MINSIGNYQKLIDFVVKLCYIKSNIPAEPLPQGKRNLAGLFLGPNNGRL